ncbi:hypothetical protein ACET3Z_000237 [Daucus carota]
MLLMRALKRNQSVEIQTPPKPSGSTSSIVSVKKQAISSNLQKQLSKKRKRVTEKPPAKKKEGLQLLKRGPVSMHRIAEDDPTMEIDRSDTWVKARQDENGNYLDDDVKTIAENIGVKKNGAKKMKNVKDCVDAIKIYKDKAKKMLKKKIIWENLAWLRRGNNTFNDDDVNDIKNSWAKFFLKHHT